MSKLIEAKGLVKLYKRGAEEVHAVQDIDLSLEKGEFLSIVGSSGSGKTTLLNLIGCVDKPTSGSIQLDGTDVTQLNDKGLTEIRSTTIGFVFQQFFLLPTLTALENVELPLLFNPRRNHVALSKGSRELLNLVGLENRQNHLPSQLSGGEMQRVAIARALINDPKILLADEPTGNLDFRTAQTVMEIFTKLNQKGLTIIMVTHNRELTGMTKRAISLKDGRFANVV